VPEWSVSKNLGKWFKTEAFTPVGGWIWRWTMTRERSKELKAVSMLTGVSFGREINVPSQRRICAGSIGTLVD
jgi:hypothetical protein